MLRSFDNVWLSLAAATEICNFVSLIVKIILSSLLPLALSVPATEKTQNLAHLSFNSNLQLINGIWSDLQKLFKYFNGAAVVAFIRVPLAAFGAG